MFRFLHSSDLHLGKPFGGFDEDTRGRLRAAREDVIDRLATAARQGGATVVLLAGDTFDQETPAPRILRQASNAMAAASDLTWVVMPGNHDSLAATELWATLARDCPDNVRLALDNAQIPLGSATLLPAPCTVRHPGRDLTEVMDQPTPEGQMRIGLGHGGITDFTSLGAASPDGPGGVITPDRARRSGLDFLCLGDWHGQIRINAHSWYSGTPEPDSFKHATQGQALLVAVAGVGAAPQVTPVSAASCQWVRTELSLTPGEDVAAVLARVLPESAARRQALVKLAVEGRLGLADYRALHQAIDRVSPDFLHFDADLDGLSMLYEQADLDTLDARGGALRQAAESLAAQAENPDLSTEARAQAQSALGLLYTFASEVEA